MTYDEFFQRATGSSRPFPYQRRLAEAALWPNALDIPTGLGKTAAVTLAWLWKRRVRADSNTPRRLVWCLPMRVLVEQTQRNVEAWLRALGFYGAVGEGRVSVHLLMGGEDDLKSWAEYPEEEMVLIGTQDMLLSRALMRGYGMSRYQWPVQFALLHTDALWVLDEIQLMGPGLATSAQMEAFRRAMGGERRSRSLWVSATLNPAWLRTVDMVPYLEVLGSLKLDADEVQQPAVRERREATKRLHRAATRVEGNTKVAVDAYAETLTSEVLQRHVPGTVTLVILNTVERAQRVMRQLQGCVAAVELLLLHARFRARERRSAEIRLQTVPGAAGRIVVATQAVEAGVDMTSRTLFTELAPWASLVQRFGRCNRYGECGSEGADVYWLDIDTDFAAPYEASDLVPGRERLGAQVGVSPAELPPTDQPAPESLVLRRKDLLELFNTDPDLSGFDIDVSPYIRDVEETDVQVFWRAIPRDKNGAATQLDDIARPQPHELCRASISQFREHLKRVKGACWSWDSVDGRWISVGDRVRPGMTLLADAALGGYLPDLGFTPGDGTPVEPLDVPAPDAQLASYGTDPRSLRRNAVPLDQHLRDVEQAARTLCERLGLDREQADAVTQAARWHDVGKAHEAFQNMLRAAMRNPAEAQDRLWAKSDGRPEGRPRYYVMDDEARHHGRPHFRHELASALAWLAHNGDAPQGDLVAYLIAAHHGKVRMGLRTQPGEVSPDDPDRLFARGIWAGDCLPAVRIDDATTVPRTELQLDIMQLGKGPQGPSWTARTQKLLAQHGPFRLAWLETLVRLADWRASATEDNGNPDMRGSDAAPKGGA